MMYKCVSLRLYIRKKKFYNTNYIYALLMNKLTLIALLFFSIVVSAQDNNIDPDYLKENIPASPEAASLGTYGEIGTNPYNGKINLSIPIHAVALEGLSIPIQLSYDSGGIRPNADASWVGMNWSLTANAAITRTIFGNDDLNENVVPNASGDISAFIYNDMMVQETSSGVPFVPQADVIDVHSSYGISLASTAAETYADTQPDIFDVSIFGKSYKFRLNKRVWPATTVTGHVFNNSYATVEYDLVNQSFTIEDDRGFTFYFTTKDYTSTISSSRSSVPDNATSNVKEHTIDGLKDDSNLNENTAISSWLLDRIVSPQGNEILYDYEEGLHFTFPTYSGRVIFRENLIDQGDEMGENYSTSNNKFTASMSIIHSNYLSKISGDFGSVDFIGLQDRRDLVHGNDLTTIFPDPFSPSFTYTTRKGDGTIVTIRENHGTTSSVPTSQRLSAIAIKDYNNQSVKNISFDHGYYNDGVAAGVEAQHLRLRLDGVTVEDKEYSFTYDTSGSLPAKGTLNTDFWGFYNGANNAIDVPSIGRFGTTQTGTTNSPIGSDPNVIYENIGQSYFNLDGGDRGADFTYGKIGSLIKVQYPTGGSSSFAYEGNKALVNGPTPYVVTDYFESSGRMRWTNLIDEDQYKFTYQYLKHAERPDYNFFDYRFDPGTTTESTPINISGGDGSSPVFTVDNGIGSVNGQGALYYIYGDDNIDLYFDESKYYVQDVSNPSNVYTLFYFGDWENSYGLHQTESPIGTSTVVIPSGSYRLFRTPEYEDGVPGVVLLPEDFTLTHTVPDTSDPDLPQFLEEFPIGGLRIKTITNTSNDGAFINKKHFDYSFPGVSEDVSSSGKLMDELIFHSKYSGFNSYTPSHPGYGVAGGDGIGVNITSNNNIRQNPSAQGSHIGYSFVRERSVDKDDNILAIIDRSFMNESNRYHKESFESIFYWNDTYPWESIKYVEARNVIMLGMDPKISFEASNGNVLTESHYDCTEVLQRSVQNEYESLLINRDLTHYSNFNGIPYLPSESDNDAPWYENGDTYITYQQPNAYAQTSVLTYSESVDYLDNGQVYTHQYNTYDTESQNMVSSETVVSDGESRITKYYYPNDSEVWDDSDIAHLRADKQYNQIVMSEAYVNDQKLATSRLYFSKNFDTGDRPLVTSSNRGKGTTAPEPRALYEKYDDDGHVLQSRLENGTPVSYIWGYNNQHVIAKVQNATYAQISTYVANLQSLSDSDTTSCLGDGGCNEQTLRAALNDLRTQSSLSEAQITTYTYDPLVGVTSITDPRGSIVYYTYDTFNRLEAVYDQNNKLLSKNEYNINHDLLATQGEDALGVAACGSNLADDPGGPGGDGPFEEDTGGRMADNTIVLDGTSYPDLSNAIDLIDTQTVGDDVTLYYQAFPYGGSGNLMYRWKIKGETFTPYSSSPTWTRVFECDTEDARGIEVICEVKDMTLNLTERSRLRHVVLCNN